MDKLISILKRHEGCRLKAYKCPAGVWTIGFGSTFYEDGRKVKEGDTITMEEAERLLLRVIDGFRKQIMRFVPASLPQCAIDALTSFAYNCGVAALQKSTLLKKIKANKLDLKGIEAEFSKWNKGNGKVLPGLVKRRRDEYLMYEEAILNQYSRYELLYMEPPTK